jgi:hypothetical protein
MLVNVKVPTAFICYDHSLAWLEQRNTITEFSMITCCHCLNRKALTMYRFNLYVTIHTPR